MPLWDFHTTPDLFSAQEKQDLANQITKLYGVLPAFYVNVRFTEHDRTSSFHGGRADVDFAVIRIEHLARQFSDAAAKKRWTGKVDEVLNPVLKPKGANWEYSILELDRDLWKINGLVPPFPNTEMEKKWVEENRAIEYDEAAQNGA